MITAKEVQTALEAMDTKLVIARRPVWSGGMRTIANIEYSCEDFAARLVAELVKLRYGAEKGNDDDAI